MQTPLIPDRSSPSVPVRNVKQFIERGLAAGYSVDVLLQNSGIDRALRKTLLEKPLSIPETRITYQNFIEILKNINRLKIYPRFFIDTSNSFSIARYGMLGYAMMSSDTLRKALQIALKYYRTSGPLCDFSFDFGSEEGAQEVLIQADDVFELGDELLPLVIEDLFSGFPPLLRMLVGRDLPLLRVEFSYPQPAHLADYQQRFKCPLIFNAATNRFVLSKQYLDLPLVQADADAALMFEESCRNLLHEIEDHDSLSNRIRKVLLSSPGNLMSADEMAESLHIGTRTLRRRLAREHASYQKLLDEVRGRIAIDYLKTTTLSSQQIAELLGYTEATNFRRAFVRWTGCSPGRYRKTAATVG